MYQSTNDIDKANDLVETLEGWNILRLERKDWEERGNQDQDPEQPAATLSFFQLIRTLVNQSEAKHSTK